MWYLSSESDQRILYVVPLNKEVIIGRNADGLTCTFVIADDPSISRKHAVLSITEDGLYIQDSGSRYFTFINDEKLEPESKLKLNNSDVVKFGKLNCVWKVHEVNLTTCTSTLKGENLQTVKTILGQIGGIVKTEWEDDCRFLTMPVITLTVKVVLALVQGCNIVTTEYWNKCLDAVKNNVELPSPHNFVPKVVESTLNKEVVSFVPNEQRKTLFAGKKFVFFHKRQQDMYKNVLMKSSAESVLFREVQLTKAQLCDPAIILIQDNKVNASQDTPSQRSQINEIYMYLKSKGKRPIPESDIGLALLYCSVDKYCNTDFSISHEIIRETYVKKAAKVLALESQSQKSAGSVINKVIDESLTAIDNSMDNIGKRKLSEDYDDIQSNANKKIAIGPLITPTEDTCNKRKLTEDNNTSNPPKKMAFQNNSEDDDLFNFINPGSASSEDKKETETKRLNLARPTKRKAHDDDGDNLFNFIEINKSKLSNDTESKEQVENDPSKSNYIKKTGNINADEISAMRGIKLAELMRNNVAIGDNTMKVTIKKEKVDALDEQMSRLDLGMTIVTIRENLIVKKEPIEINETNPSMKNFKKFKKVWPLKMQVTPKVSMSMTIVGGN